MSASNIIAPSTMALPDASAPELERVTDLPEADAQQQAAESVEAQLADFHNQEGWRVIKRSFDEKIAALRSPAIGPNPDYELIGKNYVVAQEVIVHLEQVIAAVEGAFERVRQGKD